MALRKRILALFCSLFLLSGLSACKTQADSPIANYTAVDFSDSSGVYTSEKFTCVSGSGNSLRYWLKNDSNATCDVQLYKKGLIFYSKAGDPLTVEAGSSDYAVYSDPGSSTFYLRVTSTTGDTVKGTLRANQLDIATS